VYCYVGFVVVLIILVIIKIVGVMIDKGIIKWSKSLGSEDDSLGNSGITVHFNNDSLEDGLLTE
jgi:hypothetical protein